MKNRVKIGILGLFMLLGTFAFSQNRPGRERIKSLKVAFITERLNLTSEEAQVFWPLYNEHEENIEAIKRKERQDVLSKLQDFEYLSEGEAARLLDKLLDLEVEKHQLHIAYMERMSEVISAKKSFMLIRAEEDFKKRLLKEIQKRRKGG
ncbi:MAG: hypothetical protein OER83_04360 [Flavobacteriaceae bacterium]|nr:hypothetical protein [Flavobacteriaceae bacterium]